MHTRTLIAFKCPLSLNSIVSTARRVEEEKDPTQQCSMHSTLLLSPLHAHPDNTKQCPSLSLPLCVWSYKVNVAESGVVLKAYLELDMLG